MDKVHILPLVFSGVTQKDASPEKAMHVVWVVHGGFYPQGECAKPMPYFFLGKWFETAGKKGLHGAVSQWRRLQVHNQRSFIWKPVSALPSFYLQRVYACTYIYISLGEELLGHTVSIYLTLLKTAKLFSKVVCHFTFLF